MGRHVMEALGKSRVTIEDGKVIDITEPVVKYCPLFKKHRGIEELNEESIRENMEFRIRSFGMCHESRETRLDNFLSFGISELLSLAVMKGMVDAAVVAADGCGTCVLTDPAIIQGMGGRISAIMETCPIEKVVNDIGEENILDPKTTPIDQKAGADKAFSMGFEKVAVTVATVDDARYIREKYGDKVSLYAVHTTGISEQDAEDYFELCDVITSCASKYVREKSVGRATIQAGTKVPVYGATEFGAKIITLKLQELGKTPDTTLDESPFPLV